MLLVLLTTDECHLLPNGIRKKENGHSLDFRGDGAGTRCMWKIGTGNSQFKIEGLSRLPHTVIRNGLDHGVIMEGYSRSSVIDFHQLQ